jgi:hypothetical protein
MYSSGDGQSISGQPRLIILRWVSSFLHYDQCYLPCCLTPKLSVRVKPFLFIKIVGLREITDWCFGDYIEGMFDFGEG